METKTANASLMALALVEALVLENADDVQAIARATDPAELGTMLTSLSQILAAVMCSTYGLTGSVERIHNWRHMLLDPDAAAEWFG